MAKKKTESETQPERECPIRAEFCDLELDAEQHRLIGVFAQSIGISQSQYLRAFSHGASFQSRPPLNPPTDAPSEPHA